VHVLPAQLASLNAVGSATMSALCKLQTLSATPTLPQAGVLPVGFKTLLCQTYVMNRERCFLYNRD